MLRLALIIWTNYQNNFQTNYDMSFGERVVKPGPRTCLLIRWGPAWWPPRCRPGSFFWSSTHASSGTRRTGNTRVACSSRHRMSPAGGRRGGGVGLSPAVFIIQHMLLFLSQHRRSRLSTGFSFITHYLHMQSRPSCIQFGTATLRSHKRPAANKTLRIDEISKKSRGRGSMHVLFVLLQQCLNAPTAMRWTNIPYCAHCGQSTVPPLASVTLCANDVCPLWTDFHETSRGDAVILVYYAPWLGIVHLY